MSSRYNWAEIYFDTKIVMAITDPDPRGKEENIQIFIYSDHEGNMKSHK